MSSLIYDWVLPSALIGALAVFFLKRGILEKVVKKSRQMFKGARYKDALLFDKVGGAWTCIRQVRWLNFEQPVLETKIGKTAYKFELKNDFGYWDTDGRLKLRFDINKVLPTPPSAPQLIFDPYFKGEVPVVQANGGTPIEEKDCSPMPNIEVQLKDGIDHPIVIAAKTKADIIEHTYGGKWNKFLMIMAVGSIIALVAVVFIFAGLPQLLPKTVQPIVTTSKPPVVVP